MAPRQLRRSPRQSGADQRRRRSDGSRGRGRGRRSCAPTGWRRASTPPARTATTTLRVRRNGDPRGPGRQAWPPTPVTSWRAGAVGLRGRADDCRVGDGRRCRRPGVATSWLVGRGWRASEPMGAYRQTERGTRLDRQHTESRIPIAARAWCTPNPLDSAHRYTTAAPKSKGAFQSRRGD